MCKRTHLKNGVVISASLIMTVCAVAGDGVTNYYAVLCGVSNYKYVNDLYYCDDDVRDVKAALLATGNWESSNITALIDKAATKVNIQKAIQNMCSEADDDDVCLFYFSGHGTNWSDLPPYDEIDGYDEYLVTYEDCYINDAICDDELGVWISALPTTKYIILIDTCFSGGQIAGLGTTRGLGKTKPQKGDGFCADIIKAMQAEDIGGGGIVLAACDDDELSVEYSLLENGVFTYFLVAGMAGEADGDNDERITAEESYAYTAPWTTAYNPDQHPQIYDGYAGNLDFVIYELTASKCKVKAGSIEGMDSISVKGEMAVMEYDLYNATEIAVKIDSNDLVSTYIKTFPIDGNTFNEGKYRYSKTEDATKTSFKYKQSTHKFTFSAKNIDLLGLACPVTMRVTVGDCNIETDAEEAVINGKKPIPINLLTSVIDSLRVDKLKLSRGTTEPNTDYFSIKGGFAVVDTDVNLVNEDVNVTLGSQTWTIPAGSFIAKTGRFKCSKILLSDNSLVSADFNFRKCTFKLTLKYTGVLAGAGTTNFRIEFGAFNGEDEVILP
jgi:hypothetical protein